MLTIKGGNGNIHKLTNGKTQQRETKKVGRTEKGLKKRETHESGKTSKKRLKKVQKRY